MKCRNMSKWCVQVGSLIYDAGQEVIKEVANSETIKWLLWIGVDVEKHKKCTKAAKLFDGKKEKMLSGIICTKECVLEILGHWKLTKVLS